jgi:predicted homoserine dehydrogenase-like protein
MVYGKLMPAADSLAANGLPIGLAHDVVLKQPVRAGQAVRWQDVTFDANNQAIRLRREMEDMFRRRNST